MDAVGGEAWGIERAEKILLASPVRNAAENGDFRWMRQGGEAWGVERAGKILPASPVRNAAENGDFRWMLQGARLGILDGL